MSKPFFLLTGDDSVRGEGLIVLKRVVEKFADFQIVATRDQQTAVGAAIQLRGGTWGTEVVDGTEVIWVDGYPTDAVYFYFDHFRRKPDLVLSGINHGENIEDPMLPHSGTIAAVLTATMYRDTPSIAFSRRIVTRDYLKEHDGNHDAKLLDYPGKLVERIIKKALEIGIPAGTFWNVNFPHEPTDTVKVVKTGAGHTYDNHQTIGEETYSYSMGGGNYTGWPEDTDAGGLERGYATLTPCRLRFTDEEELARLETAHLFDA
jgi:5'-nucleotidase